jgi:hypothetical protein
MTRVVVLAILASVGSVTRPLRAAEGDNEACPARSADADDVRAAYDPAGHLTRQVRLRRSALVEEVRVSYDAAGHATERTETGPEGRRVARSAWNGDKVITATCAVDGRVVATTTYVYEGDRLIFKHEASEGAPARTTTVRYDAYGEPIGGETRADTGELQSRWEAERAHAKAPVKILLTGGGAYQSDTNLFDASTGVGLRRRPTLVRYGGDPLEVALDGSLRFHRSQGLTSTDQTHARLAVDYNLILPRTTLFTFTTVDRNLPANLKLNLEEGFLGVKYDLISAGTFTFDASFAPVWTLRAIVAPAKATSAAPRDVTSSTLRGSFRLRLGYGSGAVRLTDVLEFLPAFYGDDIVASSRIGERSILRNTVALDVNVGARVKLRQEVRYTRDPSMRAQASCPDAANPLCLGYAVATLTSLAVEVDVGQ